MKKIPTLSIGIPAYNEAANIKQLLQLLLLQKEDNFHLDTIYIISDGSTDNTVHQAQALKDKRIYVKDDKKRLGKSARLEEIFRLNTSDVLILMDADVVVKDSMLLSKLFKSVDFATIGIASINAKPTLPKTFFERSLHASVYATKLISEGWNKGDNYLSFKGCFLALSGKLVKQIHVPSKIINNDAFLYFAAKEKGFKAAYVKECTIYYHSPKTLHDHIKQSSRFQFSQQELLPYFSKSQSAYTPPRSLVINSLVKTLFVKHIYFLSYLVIHLLSIVKRDTVVKPTWSIAGSTKQKIALSN